MFCAAFRSFVVWGKRFTSRNRVLVVRCAELAKSLNLPAFEEASFCLNRSLGSEIKLKPASEVFSFTTMSPRGKAKAKKDVEENGREKRVRESRNVKAASYKDLTDSEEDKPARRRKKVSDSDASVSEEEKPKKRVAKGKRTSARSRKEESESEEVSEFNSEESSGEESNKRRKPARKPARSLRNTQKTSYKDLSDSEEDSNKDDDDEEDDESSSEKEEKRKGGKLKKGRSPKSAKKSKKDESTGSEDDEEDIEDEDEEEEKEVKKSPPKKKPALEPKNESGTKVKDENNDKTNAKVEKQTRPEHEMSEEEEDDVKKEEDQGKAESKEVKDGASDSKKRGRPPKKVADLKEEEGEDDEDEEVEEEPQSKKAKVADKPALNKTDSDYSSIDFSSEAKTKDGKPWNFKISSWNVAGLKAWVKKNGLDFIKHENPDILCLQETKCSEKKLPPEAKVEGYHPYWLSGEKEGYAGVAILSKTKPLDVKYGIELPEFDNDGRVITAEFEKFYIVNVYVPNAGQGLKTLPRRLEWDPAFRAYLKKLDEKKPVILCGDLNVAHSEIDLANPKTNTKSAGFTPQEREGMTQLLKEGFVDTFRNLYPDKTGAYSFWTYMSNARSRNVGWRLDYFITSERFLPQVCDNVIRSEVYGSDHCPITLFAHV